MKILILAGGFATRLWPITENRAKPLLLLDGKTILAHLLDQLQRVRDEDIIILTNKKFVQDFEQELSHLGREKIQIFIEDSDNEGAKLGALRAVSRCLEHFEITQNVALLAGDNILTDFSISQLEVEADQAKIIIREVDEIYQARKFGVVEMGDGNRVRSFEEKPEHPKSKLVSTGFMSLGVDLFPLLHTFAETSPDNLGGIFQHLLSLEKEILAHHSTGQWFDIGSFETYLEAHKTLQKEALKGESGTGNTFSGKVFIAPGSEVSDSVLIDTILYPGVKISNCQLSHCIIDQDTTLENVDLNHKIVRKNTRLISD